MIWATDLIETRSTSKSGKGQPSVNTYSYSASFAVLLSARPIIGIGRIWAEGKLLRGRAGDFKAATGFRLHPGGEDQPADPLIASAEGMGLTPAHRGCAYAVFDALQLADYGNRIPSLTFEVFADAGSIGVGTIAEELADEVSADVALGFDGFAASGGSVRAVLETLAGASGAWFAPDGPGLAMRNGAGPVVEIGDDGAAADARGATRTRAVAAIDGVPRTISVSHYDAARDYQTGVQRARRPGAGNREERAEVPAVIGAGVAKGIAEAMLARAEQGRVKRTAGAGWRQAALLYSLDDGASWVPAGGTAAPAVIGTIAVGAAPAPDTLFDTASTIEVVLARAGMMLADADDAALDSGANLAIAGNELIQFGSAEPVGPARWRLTRLLRGRRGSEKSGFANGDRFALIETDAARTIDLPLSAIGGAVRVMASGVGDGAVGAAPTGAWAGQARAIAGWTDGGWRFIAPASGMAVWSEADGAVARYAGGAWTVGDLRGHRLVIDGVGVVGARAAAIADPAGGTAVDPAARTAILAILAALRGHGLIAA